MDYSFMTVAIAIYNPFYNTGKSTFAFHFSNALAFRGMRVALVDTCPNKVDGDRYDFSSSAKFEAAHRNLQGIRIPPTYEELRPPFDCYEYNGEAETLMGYDAVVFDLPSGKNGQGLLIPNFSELNQTILQSINFAILVCPPDIREDGINIIPINYYKNDKVIGGLIKEKFVFPVLISHEEFTDEFPCMIPLEAIDEKCFPQYRSSEFHYSKKILLLAFLEIADHFIPIINQAKNAKAYRERTKLTQKLRYWILQRDNFTCKSCGATSEDDGVKLHVDHIVPVSKGGLTEEENLQVLCNACNSGKSDFGIPQLKINAIK